MNFDFDIYQCQQLRYLGVVDLKVELSFKALTSRARCAAVRYLREAWIRTTDKSGVGLLTAKLFETVPDVWHLRGARKYRYVSWLRPGSGPPAAIREALMELIKADIVARQLQGDDLLDVGDTSWGYVFRHINPEEHIPQILAPYANSPEYLAAVAPLIALVESGETVQLSVKPPKWNGAKVF